MGCGVGCGDLQLARLGPGRRAAGPSVIERANLEVEEALGARCRVSQPRRHRRPPVGQSAQFEKEQLKKSSQAPQYASCSSQKVLV